MKKVFLIFLIFMRQSCNAFEGSRKEVFFKLYLYAKGNENYIWIEHLGLVTSIAFFKLIKSDGT